MGYQKMRTSWAGSRCPCPKKKLTKKQARYSAAAFKAEHGVRMEIYKCPYSHKVWHIGHPVSDRAEDQSRENQRRMLETQLKKAGRNL